LEARQHNWVVGRLVKYMNGLPMASSVLPVALPGNPADRLSALFDAHHDRLYRLARRLAPDADDALDLVQETFLKAARSPTSVPRGLTSEEAWLVRVLINIRRDQWRKTAVRRRHDREMSRSTSVDNDQEAVFMARATVWRALDMLTPRRRAVVVMHELEGLTISAIASLLGISAITVRWHLSRGRRDLARALRPQIGETNENR
jgi:RNA polymerase sigma-70 factor, ECF subfamily